MRSTRRRVLATAAVAAALFARTDTATALAITHTVNGSLSMLSADVAADLAIVVNRANGAQENGTASVNGSLTSTPQGTVDLDWGHPTWSGNLEVPAGGVALENPNPGVAAGTATIRFFDLIDVGFDLSVNVDTIDIGLASDFSTPTNPAPPGPGPWTGSDLADLLLSAQLDFSATGPFGISVNEENLEIGPSVVSGVDLEGTLSRLGGNPGAGTRLELPFSGLSISLPPQPTSNIPTPGCELRVIFCLLDITSVDVTLSSLTLSNIQGMVVADAATPISYVPEPNTFALLGLGLLGLARCPRLRATPIRHGARDPRRVS